MAAIPGIAPGLLNVGQTLLIPVTGFEDAPVTSNLVYAGIGLFGIGFVMSGALKRLEE